MADIEYIKWLQGNQVRFNGIEAGYVSEGWRGVLATKDIQPGELILGVPERLLISVQSACRSQQLQEALSKLGSILTSEQVLCIHLIHEYCKGPASLWSVYLRQLPRSYATFANFAPAHISMLQLEHAQHAAAAAAEATAAQWRECRPVLAALELPAKWQSRSAWRWAAATISSRTMYLASDPAGALMPFGDLHNYEAPPPPYTPDILVDADAAGEEGAPTGLGGHVGGDGHFNEEHQEYWIVAGRRYQAGDQVFLCYGQHTNLELCEHYGFLLMDNPHDTVLLPPTLLSKAVGPHLGSPPAAACLLHANGQPGWELLAALRRAAASPPELRQLGHHLLEGRRVSAAGDRRVLRWLAAACHLLLASLPTTLEADEQLLPALACDPLQECAALAIRWRVCYKRTLRSCIRICTTGLQQLAPLGGGGTCADGAPK